MRCSRKRLAGVVGALLLASASPLGAQGTCEVNNQAACTVPGDAVQSLYITISANARLDVPVGDIVVGAPTNPAALESGFSVPVPVSVTVRSNTTWSLALSAGAATWTGTPGSARQTKPAADLQWGASAGGPFSAISLAPTALGSGNATGGQSVPLFLRAAFDFQLDVAGSYQLPITLILTAP